MRVYFDTFSQEDELLSDSYNLVSLPEFSGAIGEVTSRMITKGSDDVDIGCGNAFGAAGEEEEKIDESKPQFVDILDAFRYQETTFSKKDYGTYIKGYMKKLLTSLQEKKPDRVDGFKEGCKKFVNWVLENFDKLTFYTPESYETDNMIIISYYKNGDTQPPVFLYFLDGFREVKMWFVPHLIYALKYFYVFQVKTILK